jgi:hypothetical protein
MTFEWQCPFCQRSQIVTEQNFHDTNRGPKIGDTKYGGLVLRSTAIRCSNPKCNEATVRVEIWPGEWKAASGDSDYVKSGEEVGSWRLLPQSYAKPQPDFIPVALREDYQEACLIRDLSPKAAATLARRCLQGMIRDFCGISKNRLIDEIDELRQRVTDGSAPRGVEPETIDAIDHVRQIGNIGAHMEKDINVIVDVDPAEAQALIELVEMLFTEWYVARNARRERLSKITSIAQSKTTAKAVGAPETDS